MTDRKIVLNKQATRTKRFTSSVQYFLLNYQ